MGISRTAEARSVHVGAAGVALYIARLLGLSSVVKDQSQSSVEETTQLVYYKLTEAESTTSRRPTSPKRNKPGHGDFFVRTKATLEPSAQQAEEQSPFNPCAPIVAPEGGSISGGETLKLKAVTIILMREFPATAILSYFIREQSFTVACVAHPSGETLRHCIRILLKPSSWSVFQYSSQQKQLGQEAQAGTRPITRTFHRQTKINSGRFTMPG